MVYTSLTSVNIPESVTNIASDIFKYCSNLQLTSLHEGLITIGDDAFFGTGITLKTLPNSITTIESGVFSNCTKLTVLDISNITSIGNYAFDGCTGLIIDNLPTNITSIGNRAFSACTSLTNMEIAATTLGTGKNIFYNCTGLQNVWIRSICSTITAASASKSPFSGCSIDLNIYAESTEAQSGWGAYFNRTGSSGGTSVTVTYGQTECPW